ncbi:MAG: rhomboid family intramembrane serine protease [Oligoflexia bacterium]|nr:rhomboid family intramembrane serine protease [Oligoflexia bacterium]
MKEDMYKFGELKDERIAQEIKKGLEPQNIEVIVSNDNHAEVYELFVTEKYHLPIAFDFYRVKLGFPPEHEVDPKWAKMSKVPLGIATKIFIIVSVVVFFLTNIMKNYDVLLFFYISDSNEHLDLIFSSGQWWRLITPSFLHFGFLHIVFNLMWLKTLGSIFEEVYKTKKFLIFFLVSAALSNILQFYVTGFKFGGMSGFVYALLGFIWVYPKLDKDFEYSLPKNDAMLMIFWFFLCFSGLIGNIANTAHGVGLGVGILWALFQAKATSYTTLIKWSSMAIFFSLGTFLIEYFQVFRMLKNIL